MANFHIIETGYFLADGGAMFGPIPKKYWQKRYPCDNNNMCLMAMRCLFIETGERRILVDCGAGDKQLAKLKYYRPHNLKELRSEIGKIGYSPEEVTDVVLTHLHFDHCGGGTVFNEAGNIVPAFPRATYWLSRAQWDNYRNPMLYEASSFFPENIEPVYEAGLLRLIESDRQLGDSATLKLYYGHTPGQIVLFLDDDGEQIIFPADVVPTSAHLSLGWLSAYDNNAALAMEEKKRFLDEAKVRNATLIFFHDAYSRMEQVKP
ncbi:MBL fold metallo-hydrolase [Petrimonas mucosa]|uniref:Putative quorum-quenching lactonase YtnP n=1 Tax=Petrimonas mucosa TaxID=1642646 RepID=A0A1G4G6L1_9BACT|nr:MBL fold metallo-hydrolase [Petrimonas mucosa]SCM57460.1 putative quorum-quenching lactonase YtnP [Petrimonas mucosa]